jgi:hypothetical protein
MPHWLLFLPVVGALFLPQPALADFVVPVCDEHQITLEFAANSPCVGDSIYVRLWACRKNCLDLWSTWWSEETRTLNLQTVYWPQSCDPFYPCLPETLIGFGGIADAPGNGSVTLRVQTTVVFDSVTCVSAETLQVNYATCDPIDAPPLSAVANAPRPNPTSGEVTLSLSLDRVSEVETTVHDLTGRRIATLHRGRLEAGPHTFTWSGQREGGEAAPNGVYFVRTRVDSRVLTRKLTLLRGR